ncbi:unnamed protein product [Porites lobata]|uniref:Glycosyltransferase n=1 Tax=Porites lobata TaxID=104759 RepID=A0ABN8R7R0_9CNID|nr:unnamed protein product [Porites lobata]
MAASSSQPETMKAECSLDNPKACYSESSDPVLHVTLLGSEWGSSAGGLSTINRELAIHLSNHSAVKVSLLVPEGACNTEEIREADGYGITIVEAKERAAFDRLDWLSSPPKDHVTDIVVGHGVKLGRQVQFIRDSSRFPNCKWVQVVHTAPEDLSRYKCYSDPISKGETKHESEVELCKLADLVVPVGPRLKEAYTSYLQRYKTGQDVLSITPGLFQREFGGLIQTRNEHAEFKVLLFGRGDDEDFELKGYNIAAQAFTDRRLKNKPYHLIFVGAPDGKQEKVRKKLLQREIAEAQLTVRKYLQSREKLKDLLCEADLAIMPSKSEGFGLVALEALSAGLPVLVGSKSGFAKALENVLHGNACIVNSDDPAEWAKAIEAVRIRHGMRLQEIKSLRASYEEMYSWKEQCEALVNRMWKMSHEDSLYIKARSSLETKCNVSQRMEGMTEDHEKPSIEIYNNQRTNSYDGKQLVSEASLGSNCEMEADAASGYQTKISTDTDSQSQGSRELKMPGFSCNPNSVVITALIEVLVSWNAQDLTDAQQRILKEEIEQSVHKYRRHQDLSSLPVDSSVARLTEFLKKAYEVAVMMVKSGSLIITVQCLTLESLESLWNGYCSGYLNDIVERFLVTDEIKRKLGMDDVRLKTTIEEENYLICKKAFLENSGEWGSLSRLASFLGTCILA